MIQATNLNLVTPAGEVPECVDRHSDVGLECQSVDGSGIQTLNHGQFLPVSFHQIRQPSPATAKEVTQPSMPMDSSINNGLHMVT